MGGGGREGINGDQRILFELKEKYYIEEKLINELNLSAEKNFVFQHSLKIIKRGMSYPRVGKKSKN